MMTEQEWSDEIYFAGEREYSNDPDLDAEVVCQKIVWAVLLQLIEAIETEKPRDVLRFIKNVV